MEYERLGKGRVGEGQAGRGGGWGTRRGTRRGKEQRGGRRQGGSLIGLFVWPLARCLFVLFVLFVFSSAQRERPLRIGMHKSDQQFSHPTPGGPMRVGRPSPTLARNHTLLLPPRSQPPHAPLQRVAAPSGSSGSLQRLRPRADRAAADRHGPEQDSHAVAERAAARAPRLRRQGYYHPAGLEPWSSFFCPTPCPCAQGGHGFRLGRRSPRGSLGQQPRDPRQHRGVRVGKTPGATQGPHGCPLGQGAERREATPRTRRSRWVPPRWHGRGRERLIMRNRSVGVDSEWRVIDCRGNVAISLSQD